MTNRQKMLEMLGLTEEDMTQPTSEEVADMAYVNSELALALIDFLMEGDL